MNSQSDIQYGPTKVRSILPVLVLFLIGMIATPPMPARGQGKPAGKPPEKSYEDVNLTTRDGVVLRCTYYAGPEKKTTVPLILLHDWDGRRGELHRLALVLQRLNHAVIVPDLRGHGDSLRRQGSQVAIDREKMRPQMIELTRLDVEAVKNFLMKENNEGKLNIEQLCVVGTGFGATLALDWAVRDWNVPPLGRYKQGQDVKGLVLVSPRQSFKGMNLNRALKDQRVLSQLSVLFIAGRADARRFSDVKRIEKAFRRAHKDDDQGALPFLAANTSLQGVQLLYARGFKALDWVGTFVDKRLVARANLFPWTDRTNPYK